MCRSWRSTWTNTSTNRSGAGTARLNLTPQPAGLHALSLGLSQLYADDHEMLRLGMVMYDALHAWCRSAHAETHA